MEGTGSGHDAIVAYGFVAVQLGLIAAVVLLPAGDAWTVPPWVGTATRGLQLIGWAVLIAGMVNLGRSLTALPTPAARSELRTGGLYRVVRHPIYSGLMALTLGSAIRSGSLVVAAAALALAGWLTIKARWEERRLVDRHPGYAAYAARTPRFVPFWPSLGKGQREP